MSKSLGQLSPPLAGSRLSIQCITVAGEIRVIRNFPKGSVLLLALLILSSVLAASTAVGTLVVREIRANRQLDDALVAYYAAESGIEEGLWRQVTKPEITPEELATTSPTVKRTAEKTGKVIDIPFLQQGKSIIVDLYNPTGSVAGGTLAAGITQLTITKSGGEVAVTCIEQTHTGSCTPFIVTGTTATKSLVPTEAYRLKLEATTDSVRAITLMGTDANGAYVILPTPLIISATGAFTTSRQGVGASLLTPSPLDSP